MSTSRIRNSGFVSLRAIWQFMSDRVVSFIFHVFSMLEIVCVIMTRFLHSQFDLRVNKLDLKTWKFLFWRHFDPGKQPCDSRVLNCTTPNRGWMRAPLLTSTFGFFFFHAPLYAKCQPISILVADTKPIPVFAIIFYSGTMTIPLRPFLPSLT